MTIVDAGTSCRFSRASVRLHGSAARVESGFVVSITPSSMIERAEVLSTERRRPFIFWRRFEDDSVVMHGCEGAVPRIRELLHRLP